MTGLETHWTSHLRLNRVGECERGLGTFLKICRELGDRLRETDRIDRLLEFEVRHTDYQIERDVVEVDQFIDKCGLQRDLYAALSIQIQSIAGNPAETFLQVDHADARLGLLLAVGPLQLQAQHVLLGFGGHFSSRRFCKGHFQNRVERQSTKSFGGL